MANRGWNEAVGRVIAAILTDDFPRQLVAALGTVAPFDYSVMFAYRGDQRPLDLFDNFPTWKRRIMVSTYQDGPYLLDPLYLACARSSEPGLYRLRDLAPDRFYQSEYFRSYYVQTGLSEEIGYNVALPGDVRVVVSLMRAARNPTFSNREFALLSDCFPVVGAAAARHWHELHRSFDGELACERPSMERSIDQAFRTFGRAALTQRERSVVEYVLKGHSSEAIGAILGIAPGTVRIHRKNIYAKLGIRSQGELFSRFIEAITEPV